MTTEVCSVLVKYFKDLQTDPDVAYPQELNQMNQNGIDFEVSKLFEHILENTSCTNPFLMDVSEAEVIRLFKSNDDNIRVSALLSIMSERIPKLQLKARV